MKHTIYYSKEQKTLIVIPNMGEGIKIQHNRTSIIPVTPLNWEIKEDGTYKEIRSFDIA